MNFILTIFFFIFSVTSYAQVDPVQMEQMLKQMVESGMIQEADAQAAIKQMKSYKKEDWKKLEAQAQQFLNVGQTSPQESAKNFNKESSEFKAAENNLLNEAKKEETKEREPSHVVAEKKDEQYDEVLGELKEALKNSTK